jgi:preprotein translocase subunit SecB
MSQDLQKAQNIISVVQLESVRLVQASARTTIRSPEEAPEVTLFLDYSATASKDEAHSFYVLATVGIALASSPGEKNPPVSVKAKFELKYRVPESCEVSKKEITAFANLNGIYNAWPYFREFVQSTTARMDLPSIILPVFRVPASNQAKPKTGGEAKA